MEQHEAPGSNATGLDGNQDASDANARDDRYMHSHGMSRDEYYRYELDRLEREPRRDASTRERWRKEEAWIGAETEIGPMKEEVKKRKDDGRRIRAISFAVPGSYYMSRKERGPLSADRFRRR